MRVRSTSMASVTLRLAEALQVRSVVSVEYGPLLHLRVRGQDTLLVTLPRVVPQDSDLTLIVTYDGRLTSQDLDVDTIAVAGEAAAQDVQTLFPIEPHYLLSNRAYWYPQNPVWDFATATIRVTVPDGYRAVASGELQPPSQVIALRDGLTQSNGASFVVPLESAAALPGAGRLADVAVSEKAMAIEASRPGADIDKVTVAVEAQPRLHGRGRQIATQAEDIMRFYSNLVGEAPFTSMTIALVESDLPGGHSPGYFAVVNDPVPSAERVVARRPGVVRRLPRVLPRPRARAPVVGTGGRLEELPRAVAERGVRPVLRRALRPGRCAATACSPTCCASSGAGRCRSRTRGPMHLGYRLGHIKGDLRVYRAIVYNKGAAVLHMLRRLLGDEAFFAGPAALLRRPPLPEGGHRRSRARARGRIGPHARSLLRALDLRHRHPAHRVQVDDRRGPRDRAVQPARRQRVRPAGDGDADARRRPDPRRVVPVTEADVEEVIPTDAPVRRVQVNLDSAAIAEFEGS